MMSVDSAFRGRHLRDFDCVRCGRVEHDTALELFGEVLLCWGCICDLVSSGLPPRDADDGLCPMCWPTICPPPCGVPLASPSEHSAHLAAAHPRP